MKKLSIILALVFLAACTKLLSPTQGDADRAATKFPGTTLADLNQGKTLYEQNCGKCHGLKKPTSESEEGWRKIMPPMAKKAKINAQQEEMILKYVLTMREHSK